jgi:hypothetical protein
MDFFNSNYILVGNLDAHIFFFSALGEAVFEENGFAGVRSQHADRGNMNVARAIVSFDTFTHEKGVSRHRTPVPLRRTEGSIVPQLDIEIGI